jgi:hypothetical protein
VNGHPAASGATLVVFLLFSGCASNEAPSISAETPVSTLQQQLYRVERNQRDRQQQLADYLSIAEIASQQLEREHPAQGQVFSDPVTAIYNRATADFVVSWFIQNRPQEIYDARNRRSTHLSLSPASKGAWSPSYFSSFENARRVDRRRFWKSTDRFGLGGTLIGIHPTVDATGAPQRLEPPQGFRIAVTALLRFNERPKTSQAQLELANPRIQDAVWLGKRRYSLAADFTAPAATYAKVNEF